jgi:pyridoxamine 5'-phosphate oxidase
MDISIADLRLNYTLGGLHEADLDPDPFSQFQLWLDEAISAGVREPNAMTLATATIDGKPSARIVLLKGLDDRGFVFYTNYDSLKGKQLIDNPHAALVFLWGDLERQVRIEGTIEKVSTQESDTYFYSRPFGSQLGAWVSNQSEVIANREVLEKRLEAFTAEYTPENIDRPPHWGGFRLIPTEIEFWQGRPNRLHDRLRYRQNDGEVWIIERLAP